MGAVKTTLLKVNPPPQKGLDEALMFIVDVPALNVILVGKPPDPKLQPPLVQVIDDALKFIVLV